MDVAGKLFTFTFAFTARDLPDGATEGHPVSTTPPMHMAPRHGCGVQFPSSSGPRPHATSKASPRPSKTSSLWPACLHGQMPSATKVRPPILPRHVHPPATPSRRPAGPPPAPAPSAITLRSPGQAIALQPGATAAPTAPATPHKAQPPAHVVQRSAGEMTADPFLTRSRAHSPPPTGY